MLGIHRVTERRQLLGTLTFPIYGQKIHYTYSHRLPSTWVHGRAYKYVILVVAGPRSTDFRWWTKKMYSVFRRFLDWNNRIQRRHRIKTAFNLRYETCPALKEHIHRVKHRLWSTGNEIGVAAFLTRKRIHEILRQLPKYRMTKQKSPSTSNKMRRNWRGTATELARETCNLKAKINAGVVL